MDGTQDLDIGFQEVTVKNKRVKKTGSKIFKKLLEILHSGKEKHVIKFTNDEKTEFEIKLTDKKNKKQWHETDISLFLALDSISPRHREQENIAEKTKNRFKSNMTKLTGAGYLKYLGRRQVSKAVIYKKYRILKDCPIWDEIEEGCSLESTDSESKGSSEDISSSLGSPLQNSRNFPSSHYSCLSGESSESDGYINILYGNEGSINILPVANEKVVDLKYIASETVPNIPILYHNVDRPNWNNKNILYGNEESTNIPPVVNEEIVEAKEGHIAGVVPLNLSIVNPYVSELNWNNKNMLYGNEESTNIPLVANQEIVEAKEGHIAGVVPPNLSIVNPYVSELNWDNKNMLYGNEESTNIPLVANQEIVETKEGHIAGIVPSNLSIVNPYVSELNWTKSYFDDATMFGEVEDNDHGILKDSENPLLSSAAVTEGRAGMLSDSDWENAFKIFSFDETMYDTT